MYLLFLMQYLAYSMVLQIDSISQMNQKNTKNMRLRNVSFSVNNAAFLFVRNAFMNNTICITQQAFLIQKPFNKETAVNCLVPLTFPQPLPFNEESMIITSISTDYGVPIRLHSVSTFNDEEF